MLDLEHKEKIGKIRLEKNDVSWGRLGAFRVQIGVWGGLGSLLGPFGGTWGPPGGDLEASQGGPGTSWGGLGAS